jgi:hypothetical protein
MYFKEWYALIYSCAGVEKREQMEEMGCCGTSEATAVGDRNNQPLVTAEEKIGKKGTYVS